jgi:spore maturation protein CgeB
MKILLAGNWQWDQYEEACAHALEKLGHEVRAFSFSRFFAGRFGHYQNVLAALPGPAAFGLNRALIESAEQFQPAMSLIWRGTHVWPGTLRKIRGLGGHVASYNNDDPFGPPIRGAPWHHRYLWRWYLKGLREFDTNFVYRPINVSEAIAAGARNVEVLMPYFVPAVHHPVELDEADGERFGCDVVFVGHYEPDGREGYLAALVKAGLHVRLFGGGYWTRDVLGDLTGYFGEIKAVRRIEYTKALCGAKMCVAFLSKLNRDTYTRRCFEIPACGRILLCERTADLQRLFREDREAVFFSDPDELVRKALWLRGSPCEAAEIAKAGMSRVIADRHDVQGRMEEMLTKITCGRIDRGVFDAN